MKQWFAVQTKPRQESLAEDNLARQGFTCFLPRMQTWRTRRGKRVLDVEALFAGYLFISVDLEQENVAPVRSTKGVSGLVRFGKNPAAVPAAIIDAIRARADAEGVCRQADNDFKPGQKVRVKEGPFDGLEGVFQEKSGEHRAIVLLTLLGGTRRTALPAGALV